ncbi:uncharacterized protein BDW43DRAFT_36151 [Aspergillus alliaceus]|uniref:uncharacterized protein n=1 Tax=Petromyces alliaceus TaxID=209559 RepID=UPI0012A42CCF|nr:uncharacterized protein BDW43DRAFT_36151 [Aspergillus alliaceus]KAB8235555.1 hypothetical protein BDW43DRAFT_36151 [Aspergillus alliaceus]
MCMIHQLFLFAYERKTYIQFFFRRFSFLFLFFFFSFFLVLYLAFETHLSPHYIIYTCIIYATIWSLHSEKGGLMGNFWIWAACMALDHGVSFPLLGYLGCVVSVTDVKDHDLH